MPSANKIIQDKMIGHQVGLLRLSSGITNKLVALLNKTEDDLLRQLALKDNVRTNVLLKDIREVLNAAKSGEYNMLQKELTDLAHYEPKYIEQIIKGATPMKFNMTMPSTDMLSSIVTSKPFEGKLLKEWVDELSESRRRGIRDAVRMGMVEGQTVDQIARRIRGTRALGYKDGLMETSRRGAQAMVRTAVNHTATNARELVYVKNQDLISEVQWVSTLDARTTPICQARDGMTFPVNSGPRPPAHINCRSTTAPVVKSFRELGFDIDEAPPGTRASMDGQVPEKTTYNDWLKGQSPKMQDSILGPGRAQMFREGYSVDKFVDLGSGKHFTLKELDAMDGIKEFAKEVGEAVGKVINSARLDELYRIPVDQLNKHPLWGKAGKLSEDGQDLLLKEYFKIQKYDAFPKTVRSLDFENLKGDILFRGVSNKNQVVQFIEGDLYAGKGIFGNGTYTAYGQDGKIEALRYADNKLENLIEMKLAPDAKIIEFEQLKIEKAKMIKKLSGVEDAEALRDKIDLMKSGPEKDALKEKYFSMRRAADDKEFRLQIIFNEPGKVATALRYDAIKIEREAYMVVLNRAKVIIKK